MSEVADFINLLKEKISGDVFYDALRTGMYGTDASIYQIIPLAVVCPKDEADVAITLKVARDYKIPIVARGGGTSLAGQTVVRGIVLDFSRYMNALLEYNGTSVRVQAGIVRHQLNQFLSQYGQEFAPDPATSTRASVGGMVANNSSGTKSILYGKTSDHVISLRIMLINGQILETRALSLEEYDEILHGDNDEKQYHKELLSLTLPLEQEIRERYPKTMRRVGGYALDDYLISGCRDLNRIIIGSEGTLCIILEATLKVVALPKYKGVSVIQFDDALDAIRAVETMVSFKPAAVEILSQSLLHYSRKNLETASMCSFIKGDPAAIQMIEFYGNDPDEIASIATTMHSTLQEKNFGYAHDYYPEGKTYNDIWGIRERGLGLMTGEPTDKKGVPVIEDAAIPLAYLASFIADVINICERRKVGVDYYAHASVGVIHIKPILDMRDAEDLHLFKEIADEVFKRVLFYKGSWSSEHGDGIVRSEYLPAFYGEKIYDAFCKIKSLFDPEGLMNPGKIVDPYPMVSHLRYGETYTDQPVDSVYQYREQRDFHTAVHQCSGLGACRKLSGGTMCPSFMVTKDEADSTRGRANVLRLAMSGQLEGGLRNPEIPDVLDLCISCKACKAECPSSVDMARLKSEVMQMQFDAHGVPFKERMIAKSTTFARRFSGTGAGVINFFQALPGVKHLIMSSLGMDTRRKLPTYSSKPLRESTDIKNESTPDYILLTDTYTQFHQPESGRAAIKLLQHLGKSVSVLDAGCCQRPKISHGFLREAAEEVKMPVELVIPWIKKGVEIFVLEPGCASAWVDDIPDLINNEDKAKELKKIKTFEQILDRLLSKEPSLVKKIKPVASQIKIHGHCHQKSILGMAPVHNLFQRWPEINAVEINSGCCGMAGSFGYEKGHYEISERMFSRALGPAIEGTPDHVIIANGFSCRHQIMDFADRRSIHLAEAFDLV